MFPNKIYDLAQSLAAPHTTQAAIIAAFFYNLKTGPIQIHRYYKIDLEFLSRHGWEYSLILSLKKEVSILLYHIQIKSNMGCSKTCMPNLTMSLFLFFSSWTWP